MQKALQISKPRENLASFEGKRDDFAKHIVDASESAVEDEGASDWEDSASESSTSSILTRTRTDDRAKPGVVAKLSLITIG